MHDLPFRRGFAESVHGQSVTAGNLDSATCSDCHIFIRFLF
jgi:hypothetical protein